MKYKLTFALLVLLAGALMARTTTVGVGETVPVGGTTTTATTTTSETTTTEEEEASAPIPQMQITPADGSDAPSTGGSEWENLGIAGSGDSSGHRETVDVGESTGGTSSQGNDSVCMPALVLLGALALFARG